LDGYRLKFRAEELMKRLRPSSTAALPNPQRDRTSFVRSRLVKFVLLATVVVIVNFFFASGALATTYYSNNADPANVNNWWLNTNGTGTPHPSNFTTSGDIFILQSGQTCITAGNLTVGVGVTLQIDGTLAISGSGDTTTINGTVIFTNTSATQVTLAGSGTGNTFTLSSGATLKTTNTNGLSGTNCSLPASATKKVVTLATGANYDLNGTSNQATTGLPSTVNALSMSGSGTKTAGGVITVSATVTVSSGVTLSTANSLSVGGDWAIDGTFAQTAGTTTFQGGGTHTLSGAGSSQFNNLTTSSQTINAGASNISISGNWTHGTAGIFNEQTSSVTFNGSGPQTQPSGTFVPQLYNMTINNGVTGTMSGRVWTVTNSFQLTSGTFAPSSSSSFKNVTLGGGTFTAPTGNMNVSGDWTNNGGVFTPGSGTVTFNSTAAGQLINGTATSQTFNNATVSKTGQALSIVGSATLLTIGGTLTVSAGTFDQGASTNLTTGTISVAGGGTLKNLGTGDLTVGPGGVTNAGLINYNSNGNACGETKDILIQSSVSGSQRAWTGSGTFTLSDVDVKDQGGSAIITPRNGTNSGNNGVNWLFIGCAGGSYTWTPVVTGDWQIAANWTPVRTLPDPGDLLTINGTNTPSPIITNVPTQTVAGLRLINNATPKLQTSAANALTIDGAAGSDLSIPGGSSLTLSGSNALKLFLASGSTGNVMGDMIFQDGAHRLIGNAANAVTFRHFFTTAAGFTGNAFGTGGLGDGAAGSIIFASGSIYFHNAGSSPFGTAGNTVVVFQGGSEADYLTATGFDADGRTYATLVIGKGGVSGAVVNALDSGSGNFQFTNLAINSPDGPNSSTLEYDGSGSSMITIGGNITSVGAVPGTAPDVTLNAGSNIIINGGAAVSFGNSAGNTRSIFLGGDAAVSSGTNLSLSRLVQMGLGGNNVLTDNGTITPNVSTTGYIVGGVRKPIVPATYTFPVGTSIGYTPVDFANAGGGGDFTVTPKPTAAPVVNAATSLKEHWSLSLNSGSLTTDMTFHYLQADVMGDDSTYRLIRVDTGTAVSFLNECPTPTLGNACVNSASNTATIPGVNAFSDWTLGAPVAPTAVRLTGFSATAQDDGVMLEWRSGFEAHNLGYNLYRYQDGQRARVTPSLIAGSSLIRKHGSELASGFSYGWFDPQGALGTQYELQAIDLRGEVQIFTPRYLAKSGSHVAQKQDRALMLSDVSATGAGSGPPRGWANVSTSTSIKQTNPAGTQSLATQQWIASQPAVKIRINQTGWYRVTQPQLVANGFDSSVDARKLQLYADGAEIPIRLSTDKARLSSGDTLEFYGVGLDVLTTDTRTYYLVSGARNGLRLVTGADKGSGRKIDVLAPNFLYTVESKERIDYFPGLLNGDGNNIFGQFIESVPASQTVTLQNIDANSTAPAQLEVVIQGYTEADHHIQVQFNGSYVGTIDFTGMTNKSKILALSAALLREGANTVTLTATGGDLDFGAVDVMRVTYAHTYRADNDSLSFSVGNRGAAVSGFNSSAIRVIDITDPNAVQELTPKISNSGGSFGFSIQASGSVQNLIAFVDSLARQPSVMVRNQPSTWNASTNVADLLIVTHNDFRSSADTLAAARRAQGMRVSVVDIEDIYDEFSYGAHTPEALKEFLAWSNTHWSKTPKYALLFGDSSWDPRNFMGQGYNDYVPTKEVDTFELETASDDWLADFDADGIPEIALGRLPARTAADASTMVSKILNYDQERAAGSSLRGALLVADGGFETQSAQVQSFLAPLTTVQMLNRSAIGNDNLMQTQIVDAIDQGPTIVNYFGHGSVTVWTGAGLLNEDNASTLTNGNRPSLFVMMTCLNGYAGDAYIDSLAEIVLKNPQGGAFAVWASSGITEPVGQAQMNGRLYQLLLGAHPMTLGDAVRKAKMGTADLDVRRTWILLGDPSMRIK
jgi:hypothetical protein